jgi:hypothetical protein
VGGAAVSGGGEGLGDGDLDPGEPGPRHPVQRDGMPAVVADADGLGHVDLARLGLGRLEQHLGVLEGESIDGDHGSSMKTLSPSIRTGKEGTASPRLGKRHRPVRTSKIQP